MRKIHIEQEQLRNSISFYCSKYANLIWLRMDQDFSDSNSICFRRIWIWTQWWRIICFLKAWTFLLWSRGIETTLLGIVLLFCVYHIKICHESGCHVMSQACQRVHKICLFFLHNSNFPFLLPFYTNRNWLHLSVRNSLKPVAIFSFLTWIKTSYLLI